MNISEKIEGGLTIDKIIEKFIPVVGALFFIIWLGYLLYTSVWVGLTQEIKLWLWFFLSIVIIGWAFSFSEKLSYFADVVMGGWILLLYGTLIYGSLTTETLSATIPEVGTLVTASLFTIVAAYLASIRHSKVILALVLLGAYLTPFVIGGEWGTSTLSFNSYLIYFVIANVVVFLLGREIALRDIVPLNMIGLFLWTTTLYALSYRNMQPMSGLQGDTFTLILLTILVIVSVFGIILSSRSFASSEEGYLSVGYLIPLIWHITNVSLIGTDSMMQYIPEATYICIAIAYFYGWSVVKDLKTRYQHSALYTGWAVALVFAFVQLFPDLNFFSSIFIAYIGLIFWLLYYFHSPREERLFAYLLCSIFGGFMWLINFYTEVNIGWNSVWTTIVLIPSLLAFVLIPKVSESKFSKDIKLVLQTTSVVALLTILFTVISDILQFISLDFALFILPACIIIFMASFTKVTPQSASFMLRISMVLIAFWFFSSFIYFVMMLVPGNADGMSLWKGTENFLSNDHTIKALFSIMALSLGLRLSRKIQIETKEDRPSFVLVIFLYSIVLIFVNYLLIVGMNDIGVATGDGATGGPRAIAITFWWAILSIAMMTRGVQWGHMFRSEKLLGLLLLFVTIGKVVLYDLSTMGSTNKVIVLMLVGGGLMLFSYFFHISSWFKNEKQ
jgi:hypothetical protein